MRSIQQFAQHQLSRNDQLPQVLLATSVTNDQYTDLGLGCLPDAASFETPPLTLVILKGDFDANRVPGRPSEFSTRNQICGICLRFMGGIAD